MHPTALNVEKLLVFIGASVYPTAPFGCYYQSVTPIAADVLAMAGHGRNS